MDRASEKTLPGSTSKPAFAILQTPSFGKTSSPNVLMMQPTQIGIARVPSILCGRRKFGASFVQRQMCARTCTIVIHTAPSGYVIDK
jgi:hypothetical protein